MNENEKKLKKILSNLLKIDITEVTDDTSSKTEELWDSFNTLNIVMEMENEFEVEIDLEQLVGIKNYRDLVVILNNKGINFS